MAERSDGQVSRDAAEVYEELFLPALFAAFATRIADAARLAPGERVLDVACGTGALAREVARRVAPGGAVAGVDINPGMLAVARRKAPDIEWREGPAEALPFDARSFDVVVSQFGLMFFSDRLAALREMRRVARRRVIVAVWSALETSPGYAAMTALVAELFGAWAGDELKAPNVVGDPTVLRALFADAGMPDVTIDSVDGEARYPSLKSWIYTDIKGWTLGDRVDDAQLALLERTATERLARFVQPDGSVVFAAPALVARVQLG
jgi:SAM-dependent methyltransferase